MALSRKAIRQLQSIHEADSGVSLSEAVATAMGNRLLQMFAILMRLPKPARDDSGSNPVLPRS
jgi:hypothetical protein